MTLKSISLKNIRSYRETSPPIEFPQGTVLFEGDIGSGKSTILYAIEFALFGLGSLKGTFLLRNGASRGSVTLRFEVDGKEYEVYRTLVKKGKGVHQGDCYIKGPHDKEPLSPSELKGRILQILKFNEPSDPKAQSIIYRYAIFTPQEEMKEVILKKADERLQTLRRAFRIEDYKIAAQNSSALISFLKGRVEYLRGATADLDQRRKDLEQKNKDIEKFKSHLKPLKEDEGKLKGGYEKKRGELKKLEEAREKIKQIEAKIPLLKSQISDKVRLRNEAGRDLQKLGKKVEDELEPKIVELENVDKPTEKTVAVLKRELVDIRDRLKKERDQKAKLDERVENIESILEKRICPTCEREIDPKEFGSKAEHLEYEREILQEQIERLEKDAETIEGLIDKVRRYDDAQKDLKQLYPQLKDVHEEIEKRKETIKELDVGIRKLEDELRSAEGETKPLQSVLERIEGLGKEVRELEDRLSEIRKSIVAIEKDIQRSQEDKAKMEQEIALKERQLKLKDSINEYKIWLDEYFVPTLENIERHVMATINQRFNQHLQRWFDILIEGSELQVRVDEDFTPIIERDGYEQDYLSLSGGEKTSVALAYRLALNTIVQEVATGGVANLLILDEPTDGFSREQLFKIREILDELKCPQVIIVSHERELEGFADYVFRIEKEHGISRIVPRSK
ncbi:MAG: SMC family ATPase [archaeon]|nr:SMC family ATPase [archaeon]MCP8306390.1 SMC family ATPase [archaeon]